MNWSTLAGSGLMLANAVFSHQLPTSGVHAAQFSICTSGLNGLTMSFRNSSRSNAYENAARRFLSSNGLPGFSLNQMFSYCGRMPNDVFNVASLLNWSMLSLAGCGYTAATVPVLMPCTSLLVSSSGMNVTCASFGTRSLAQYLSLAVSTICVLLNDLRIHGPPEKSIEFCMNLPVSGPPGNFAFSRTTPEKPPNTSAQSVYVLLNTTSAVFGSGVLIVLISS